MSADPITIPSTTWDDTAPGAAEVEGLAWENDAPSAEDVSFTAAGTAPDYIPRAGGIIDVYAASTEAIDGALFDPAVDPLDDLIIPPGELLLLKDQADPSENGIYQSQAGGLVRFADYDTGGELEAGVWCQVQYGTENSGKIFFLATDPAIVIETTGLYFNPDRYTSMSPFREDAPVAGALTGLTHDNTPPEAADTDIDDWGNTGPDVIPVSAGVWNDDAPDAADVTGDDWDSGAPDGTAIDETAWTNDPAEPISTETQEGGITLPSGETITLPGGEELTMPR